MNGNIKKHRVWVLKIDTAFKLFIKIQVILTNATSGISSVSSDGNVKVMSITFFF